MFNVHLGKTNVPDSEASTSLTQLHLLSSHSDISEGAARPAGRVRALSRVVLGGDLSTQSLQLRLITHLVGQRREVMLRSSEPNHQQETLLGVYDDTRSIVVPYIFKLLDIVVG